MKFLILAAILIPSAFGQVPSVLCIPPPVPVAAPTNANQAKGVAQPMAIRQRAELHHNSPLHAQVAKANLPVGSVTPNNQRCPLHIREAHYVAGNQSDCSKLAFRSQKAAFLQDSV